MAVVYVAARIKAGSSVSPFERCNKEIHRPLRHLATGCLLLPHTWPACFFSPPSPLPSYPFALLRLALLLHLSPFISNRRIPLLVSFPFHPRTVAVSKMRGHTTSSIVQPLPRVGLLQPARGIPFFLSRITWMVT